MGSPSAVGRDAEDVGRVGGFDEGREASPEGISRLVEGRRRPFACHPAGLGNARTSAAAARRPSARSLRTP